LDGETLGWSGEGCWGGNLEGEVACVSNKVDDSFISRGYHDAMDDDGVFFHSPDEISTRDHIPNSESPVGFKRPLAILVQSDRAIGGHKIFTLCIHPERPLKAIKEIIQ